MYQASNQGIRQTSRAPAKSTSQRVKRSLTHLGSARRARQQRTGGHGLANAGCVAAQVTERDPPRLGVGPDRRVRGRPGECLVWPTAISAGSGRALDGRSEQRTSHQERLTFTTACGPTAEREGTTAGAVEESSLAKKSSATPRRLRATLSAIASSENPQEHVE